jgi:predicted transcriptional regulator
VFYVEINNALSQTRDRSVHWLAVAAIKRYLDKEEEYDRQKQKDMAEWEDYLRTEEAISGEKVVSWLKEMIAQKNYVAWRD